MGQERKRTIEGILVSTELGEMDGFKYGTLKVRDSEGEVYTLKHDRNSEGEIPITQSTVTVDIEGEAILRVIRIEAIEYPKLFGEKKGVPRKEGVVKSKGKSKTLSMMLFLLIAVNVVLGILSLLVGYHIGHLSESMFLRVCGTLLPIASAMLLIPRYERLTYSTSSGQVSVGNQVLWFLCLLLLFAWSDVSIFASQNYVAPWLGFEMDLLASTMRSFTIVVVAIDFLYAIARICTGDTSDYYSAI